MLSAQIVAIGIPGGVFSSVQFGGCCQGFQLHFFLYAINVFCQSRVFQSSWVSAVQLILPQGGGNAQYGMGWQYPATNGI